MWSLVPYKLVVLGQHICFGPKGLAWWEFLLRTRNYPTHIHINATINVRCFNLLSFACLYHFLSYDFFCILFLKRVDIPYTGDSRYLGTSLLPILKQHSRLFDDSGMTHFIYHDFSRGRSLPLCKSICFFGRFHRQWPLIESASFRFAEFCIKFPTRKPWQANLATV